MLQNSDISKIVCNLSYFIIDVDGTMTDSGLYYDSNGNELKKFSTRDFVGILAAHYVGIKTVVITGRTSEVTKRRTTEMGVDYLFQGVKNKKAFLVEFLAEHGLEKNQIGYVGDDLNDYASMQLAGFKSCPADSCVEIKEISDYVSPIAGGNGVIQDVFRFVLEKMNKWDSFIEEVIAKGF